MRHKYLSQMFDYSRMVMLTSFITLFIPFQVNVFISAQNIDIYGSILITGVLIALAATLFLLFFLAYSFGSIKQYIIAYILLAGLWFLVLVSPRLENSIIYHISLSTLSIISVEYFIWQYLSYKKEILLARRLAIQIKNNV